MPRKGEKNMTAIWKRELQALFYTPQAYVFLGFFLLAGGYFFWSLNLSAASSDMSSFFNRLIYILVFFVPVLTMRLLSEEKRMKTDQLLFTAPVSKGAIVLGKYLAACSVLLTALVLTGIYPVIVAVYGHIQLGTTLVNYLGCFLVGGEYIAVGLLISSLCENQLTAAVGTLAVNIALQALESLPRLLSASGAAPILSSVVEWLSMGSRNNDFSQGLLKPANIFYFVSFIAFMLYWTTCHLNAVRQR